MKKFRFKLEVVLKERRRIEDFKLREYSLANQFLHKVQGELTDLETRFDLAIKEATDLAAQPLNQTSIFSVVDNFISGTKIRIQWKKGEIERIAKFTERRRLEYVAARQKREALEKLKAKKIAEHKSLIRKKEAKELDDLYIMRTQIKLFEEAG